jgi:hypothetical protein
LQIKTHTSSGFWTALTRNPTFTTATLSQENNIPARGHTIYGGFRIRNQCQVSGTSETQPQTLTPQLSNQVFLKRRRLILDP